jgi:hypothetical protein
MKLNRDDFNVLIPPGAQPPPGGNPPDGPTTKGVEPIVPPPGGGGTPPPPKPPTSGEEEEKKPSDSETGGPGEPGSKKIEAEVKEVRTIVSPGVGGMLTPEESARLQEQLGVPVELPGEGDDEKYSQEARRHMDKLSSGEAGTGKGSLRRAVARLTEPQVDWKSVLKRFIGKAMSSSEQYLGSRRHLYKGDYFYGEKNKYESLENAVVAVDTSGSMSVEAIELILSEVKGIITAKKIKNTTIVYFDDGIQDTDTIKGTKKVFDMRKAKGGGGTSFVEPLRYMEEQYKKGKMQLGVFMTDGYANLNLSTPKFKKEFVWVILDNPLFVPPFGNLVVHISQKQMK